MTACRAEVPDTPGPESAHPSAGGAVTSIFSLVAKNSVPIADQPANAVERRRGGKIPGDPARKTIRVA